MDVTKSRSIIFGNTGYIGRHLLQALRADGHQVVAPVGADGGTLDLTERDTLNDLDWDVDHIFLFAGVTGTAVSFDNFEDFLRGNELILMNVLDAIRRSGYRPKVIFPSSRLVYRGSETPLRETDPLEAKTIYAVNKLACENYLRAFSNAFDIPHIILRICIPYGNLIGDDYSFGTVGNFVSQVKANGRIRLYGGGTVRRTFTHIEDLCRFILLTSAEADAVNQTFNIPGEDFSLYEAATLVAAALDVTIESVEWPNFDKRLESGSTVFDGSRLLAILNTDITHRFAEWVVKIRERR